MPRLIDTNIASYLVKGHALGVLYKPHLAGQTLLLSFMSLAEMQEWGLLANWGKQRYRRLDAFVRTCVVLDSNPGLCQWWASVRVTRRQEPIGVADAWIAASALQEDCPLITHNPHDFRGIPGLKIITEAPP